MSEYDYEEYEFKVENDNEGGDRDDAPIPIPNWIIVCRVIPHVKVVFWVAVALTCIGIVAAVNWR